MPWTPEEAITITPQQQAWYERAHKLTPEQIARAFSLLDESDQYLRAIRKEELDGSEPMLGEMLERNAEFFQETNVGGDAQISADQPDEASALQPRG